MIRYNYYLFEEHQCTGALFRSEGYRMHALFRSKADNTVRFAFMGINSHFARCIEAPSTLHFTSLSAVVNCLFDEYQQKDSSWAAELLKDICAIEDFI